MGKPQKRRESLEEFERSLEVNPETGNLWKDERRPIRERFDWNLDNVEIERKPRKQT